jgi:hypothetical protein
MRGELCLRAQCLGIILSCLSVVVLELHVLGSKVKMQDDLLSLTSAPLFEPLQIVLLPSTHITFYKYVYI